MDKKGRDYTPEELIELLYEDRKKNVWVAYILLVALGGLGAHRSYLQFIPVAAMMCIFTLAAAFLSMLFPRVAEIILCIVAAIMLFDLIFIPSMVRRHNQILRTQLVQKHGPSLPDGRN